MLGLYLWTGMCSQSCCQPLLDFVLPGLMRLSPPIKPDAVGYLDMKDVHKNTLVLVIVFCSVCAIAGSVEVILTFRLQRLSSHG